MLALIQRVNFAKVIINNSEHSSISKGLLVFLAIHKHDDLKDSVSIINRLLKIKFFEGKRYFEKDISNIKGEILVISQFTLYGNLNKGTKPSFTDSMNPKDALSIYKGFCDKLESKGIIVKRGVFGEHMRVELENDGPATFIFDTKK